MSTAQGRGGAPKASMADTGGLNAMNPLPGPPTAGAYGGGHYGQGGAYGGGKREKMPRTGDHPNARQQHKDAGTQHAQDQSVDGPLEVELGESPRVPFKARNPHNRPLHRLSVRLIDTYTTINAIYYERKARRQQEQAANAQQQASTHKANVGKAAQAAQAGPSSVSSAASSVASSASTAASGKGVYNNGWDDENYDYILEKEEVLADRYLVRNRIGKGSFGQVVRGYDKVRQCEVAIKIIKSRRPFMLQAKTEIELLEHLKDKDPSDEHNIVRLQDHFVHRGHQVLVFEMLSYNLYDLLRYTKFHGVSLTLLRKFAKQILKALSFLSNKDVDIIHCDLKPENILLRHPKLSGIKVIDFGSSCRSNKRMYSYIQSRFYRSPEVMMGLPYTVSIDMWSLGCVLVEMHTGEPLFGGVDQFDQMRRLVEVLGMPPSHMLEQSPATSRDQFFEPCVPLSESRPTVWKLKDSGVSGSGSTARLLSEIIGVSSGGPSGRRAGEAGHSYYHYCSFLDLVTKMLHYDPAVRVTPAEAMRHPFLSDTEAGPVPRPIGEAPSSNNKEEGMRSPRLAHRALDNATQT